MDHGTVRGGDRGADPDRADSSQGKGGSPEISGGTVSPGNHYTVMCNRKIAMGIAVGIAIGAGMGSAMDNVGMGVGVGLALGIALGSAWKAWDERE